MSRWLQGPISREKSEECLRNMPHGSFMIRESQKRQGEYSLSIAHSGHVNHFRVDIKRGALPRYLLFGAERSFATLEALVDYYSNHCISSRGEVLKLPYSAQVRDTITSVVCVVSEYCVCGECVW